MNKSGLALASICAGLLMIGAALADDTTSAPIQHHVKLDSMVLYGPDHKMVVVIDTDTGAVTLGDGVSIDDAAMQFYQIVGKHFMEKKCGDEKK